MDAATTRNVASANNTSEIAVETAVKTVDETSLESADESEEDSDEEEEEESDDEEALEAALVLFNKASAKIKIKDLTFKKISKKNPGSLDAAVQGAMQKVYNMAIEHASQTLKVMEENKTMLSIKKADASSSLRVKSGNKTTWLRKEFGCYRVRLTEEEMRSIRPDYRFIDPTFKKISEGKKGSHYLTNEECEALTVLRKGKWVPYPRGKCAFHFALMNRAASVKLTVKNEAEIAEGLEAERIAAPDNSDNSDDGADDKGKKAKGKQVKAKKANIGSKGAKTPRKRKQPDAKQPPAKKPKTKHAKGGDEEGEEGGGSTVA
ncbi:hypothetical protein IFR05_011512 [Cadophora sp. M221]|nr:hypothetical protein IFR05_011512 [Cadophora sp. M221]